MRADLSVDWPTWSQTSYRSWSIGETPGELARGGGRGGAAHPAPGRARRPAETVLAVLARPRARRSGPSRSCARRPPSRRSTRTPGREAGAVRWAVEATYEGSIGFDEAILEDPTTIEPMVEALTGWVSSTLVRLADLPLSFLPPDPPDPAGAVGDGDG